MITLYEENANRWTPTEFCVYNNAIPLGIQTHASDKTETNILPVSNQWMFGKTVSKNTAVQKLIALSQKDGTLKEVYNKELRDEDPEGKEKYVIHLSRFLQHPDLPTAKGVLYYDLIVNITPLYLWNERVTKRYPPQYWIDKVTRYKSFLSGLNSIDPPELIYRPFILTQGFTGGFKPEFMYHGSRYEGGGIGPVHPYKAEDYFQVPAITAEDFEALISYQNQALDTKGTTFRAWDRYRAPDGSYPFRNIQ